MLTHIAHFLNVVNTTLKLMLDRKLEKNKILSIINFYRSKFYFKASVCVVINFETNEESFRSFNFVWKFLIVVLKVLTDFLPLLVKNLHIFVTPIHQKCVLCMFHNIWNHFK